MVDGERGCRALWFYTGRLKPGNGIQNYSLTFDSEGKLEDSAALLLNGFAR
uniref:hypothetical protein n=1 Tax=Salmonella sp. TaxID=599 RepID=UPI001CD93A0A|nr:hypothetical protein [Salmonella sp.]